MEQRPEELPQFQMAQHQGTEHYSRALKSNKIVPFQTELELVALYLFQFFPFGMRKFILSIFNVCAHLTIVFWIQIICFLVLHVHRKRKVFFPEGIIPSDMVWLYVPIQISC